MNRKRFLMVMAWISVAVSIVVGCNQTMPTAQTSSSPVALAEPVTITVSAAADLNYAFQELGKQWEQETGNKITFNFGSTGQLAQQIERGASADLFAAANRKFIEDLDQRGLIQSNTKKVYGRGRIAIWARQDSLLNLKELKDLTQSDVKRVAIANPDHAPYGMAAKQAMESAGIWQAMQPKLVLGENIRQTQQYAETGNVDAAIVALSLSVQKPGKWHLIPENLHQPLEQMMAVPKSAKHAEQGRQFADFVESAKGRPIMQKYGFVLPGEAVSQP
jgi:molybdate transport system substrate-binding protein